MTIQPSEARQLCSKSEWELVESSFYPLVEALPASDLKSRLDRARKLYRKTLDLITVQHSDSRKRTTSQRTEMFARAADRFEAALNLVESDQIVEPASENADNKFAQGNADTQHGCA